MTDANISMRSPICIFKVQTAFKCGEIQLIIFNRDFCPLEIL